MEDYFFSFFVYALGVGPLTFRYVYVISFNSDQTFQYVGNNSFYFFRITQMMVGKVTIVFCMFGEYIKQFHFDIINVLADVHHNKQLLSQDFDVEIGYKS